MSSMTLPWYPLVNQQEVPSPCLLLYPDRVRENIRRMIAIGGGVKSLRPHMKTHKMPEVIRMQVEQGITRVEVLVDLDVGQHRTGIAPDTHAFDLYRLIAALPGLAPGGLHAYDGHVHESDVTERTAACEAAFGPVEVLRRKLERDGLPVPRVIAGGTPTFPMHARRGHVECSPGTCVFWDSGYGKNLIDLDFLPAALVLTR